MMGTLLGFFGLDSLIGAAKKAAYVTSFLLVLTAVKVGIDRLIETLEVAPPAAMLDALQMFLPSNFATCLDVWITAWAAAGAFKLYKQIINIQS